MALPNAAVFVLGNARVCRSRPAPGATGSALGDGRADGRFDGRGDGDAAGVPVFEKGGGCVADDDADRDAAGVPLPVALTGPAAV
jgi:hypothetical protein